MISKIYFVLAFLALLGCSSPSPQPIVSSLPVIDIDKARDYPVKCIEIREVADVEYIPLETTKKSLVADRKSTRLNSSHVKRSRMPSSA